MNKSIVITFLGTVMLCASCGPASDECVLTGTVANSREGYILIADEGETMADADTITLGRDGSFRYVSRPAQMGSGFIFAPEGAYLDLLFVPGTESHVDFDAARQASADCFTGDLAEAYPFYARLDQALNEMNFRPYRDFNEMREAYAQFSAKWVADAKSVKPAAFARLVERKLKMVTDAVSIQFVEMLDRQGLPRDGDEAYIEYLRAHGQEARDLFSESDLGLKEWVDTITR